MTPPITLTTDFGTEDGYVGVMKGVILNLNPAVTIVDLCHYVRPQDIAQAAYIIGSSHAYFPRGTIHVVVVDPEVGSGRQGIIVQTQRAYFVAPDNGVLTWVMTEGGQSPVEAMFRIADPRYWLPHISNTFHGRDIFAPVAAHLSLGVPVSQFGPSITQVRRLPLSNPQRRSDSTLVAHVIHIDRFGNLITDLVPEQLPADVVLQIGGCSVYGLSRYYAEAQGLLALVGSSGHVEIAWRDGNAAARLGAKVGDEVIVLSPVSAPQQGVY